MKLAQCKMCNMPYYRVGGLICPDCVRKIDLDFITVRDYIYDNPNARIDEVSEETGVTKAIIMYLLQEGRLILGAADEEGPLRCDICKKPIASGRMCRECKEKISGKINKSNEAREPPKPEKKEPMASKHTAKMHTDGIRGKK